MRVRFHQNYTDTITKNIQQQFGYSSVMRVPRLQKIIISTKLGKNMGDSAKVEHVMNAVSYIAGQKACFTKAKKSIAAFKVRTGMVTGVMVTLRKAKMYEFLDRLRNIALPRMRDFRGFDAKSINGKAMSFGVKDYTIFPEIRELMKAAENIGLDLTFVVNQCDDAETFKALFVEFGFPFR